MTVGGILALSMGGFLMIQASAAIMPPPFQLPGQRGWIAIQEQEAGIQGDWIHLLTRSQHDTGKLRSFDVAPREYGKTQQFAVSARSSTGVES